MDEYWVSKIDKVYQFFFLENALFDGVGRRAKCPLFFLFSDILKIILTQTSTHIKKCPDKFLVVDFLCGPLPYSLPSGSSANLTARRGAPSWDGSDVLDDDQKCPLIFIILRYIKDHTPIYLYMY